MQGHLDHDTNTLTLSMLPTSCQSLGLKVGAIVNTACYDHCPDLMAAFRHRGDEIIAHGHTNAQRQVPPYLCPRTTMFYSETPLLFTFSCLLYML